MLFAITRRNPTFMVFSRVPHTQPLLARCLRGYALDERPLFYITLGYSKKFFGEILLLMFEFVWFEPCESGGTK